MTALHLDALAQVARAATPDEWHSGDGWVYTLSIYEDDNRLADVLGMKYMDPDRADAERMRAQANADHIATFDPPTVLALLDRLQAAEAKVWELHQAVDVEAQARQTAEAEAERLREAVVGSPEKAKRLASLVASSTRLVQIERDDARAAAATAEQQGAINALDATAGALRALMDRAEVEEGGKLALWDGLSAAEDVVLAARSALIGGV